MQEPEIAQRSLENFYNPTEPTARKAVIKQSYGINDYSQPYRPLSKGFSSLS